MTARKIITVFGSSRPRDGHAHYSEAMSLGSELASRGFVVCSGGYAGVMEAVSRGAKQAGGATIGITAASFRARPNRWIDEIIQVKTWQERLFELIRRGDGYVACPGGTGTLAELAVVWEMLNKRVMHHKPFVVLGDFWRPIIDCVRAIELDHDSEWGEQKNALVRFAASPRDAADLLASHFDSIHRDRSPAIKP
jgi:uncharacterized protein (TIGR00730 family)